MQKLSRKAAMMTVFALLVGGAPIARGSDGGKNGATQVRLKTGLAGAAIDGKKPEGSADFRSDSNGRTRLNVEVEAVNLPDGTKLTVSITHAGAATNVGSVTLTLKRGELELNSQDGAIVPSIVSGDVVTVSNGAVAVLAGVF